MFFVLALLLGTAKVAGELMQRIGQPSILGEISAGILLGPTVFGHFRREWYAALFPASGVVIEAVTTLGVGFYNIVSEADLEDAAAKIESGRDRRKRTVAGILKQPTDTRTSTATRSNDQKQADAVAS